MRLGLASMAGVVLLAVAVGLVVRAARHDVVLARQALLEVAGNRAGLGTGEGRAAMRETIEGALARLNRAQARVDESAAVQVVAELPFLKSQHNGLVRLIGDSTEAALTGRDLFVTFEQSAAVSKISSGRVPLTGLQQLEGAARGASARIASLVDRDSGLWGPLGDARRQFDETARSTAARLAGGADALGVARTFMGANGDRRYLVAIQNNAEMRDQGMVLSYALAGFSDGLLDLQVGGHVSPNLNLDSPADTPIPPGTQEVFGSILPTQFWQSVNATADFAFSGRAMTDMFAKATGSGVDGVVAIDVPGLAALLRVVGPIEVEDLAEPVTDKNVGRIVLRDFYEGIETEADNLARRERLSDVTRAIIERVTQGDRDPLALGNELGQAAAGGHLRLWSADPAEEAVFEKTGLGGGPATELADRTFHVAVENRTATKLDYYIKPRVRQEVRLTKSGDAVVRTTVVVENQVPVGSGPSYALGPDIQMRIAGEYRAWLLLWAPAGSNQPGAVVESGLNLAQHVIHVDPGQTRELTFVETLIPDAVRDGRFDLRLVPQPRLEPVPLEIRLRAEGWDVEGARSWSGLWDRQLTFSWEVDR